MELWGTLRQTIGGGSVHVDSDEYVDAFFKKTRPNASWQLETWQQQMQQFIEQQLQQPNCNGIALVTSGTTMVPLDSRHETFVDCAGSKIQEFQGPASVECLLHLGYAVIHLYRIGSLMPFTRHFQKFIKNGAFMDLLTLQEDGTLAMQGANKSKFDQIIHAYHSTKHRLLSVGFCSVQQYLYLLRIAARSINVAKSRAMVVLAASVMDYYVPLDNEEDGCSCNCVSPTSAAAASAAAAAVVAGLKDPPKESASAAATASEDSASSECSSPPPSSSPPSASASTKKPPRSSSAKANILNSSPPSSKKSKQLEFSMNFVRVPKIYRKLHKEWCPRAFLATFKIGLDEQDFVEGAHDDLETFGIDVIAGINDSNPNQMLLVSEFDESVITCDDDIDVHDAFASSLAENHRHFRKRRDILQKGKQLLLLSAKFSMLKEKDVVNEDADGNKNVKFGKGMRIRADRQRNDTSAPVYELQHIFQSKTKCARCHIWEATIDDEVPAASDAKAPASTHAGQSHHNSEKKKKKEKKKLDVVVAFSPAGTPDTIRDVWGDFWGGWAENEISELKDQIMNMTVVNALDVVTASLSGDFSRASALIQYVTTKIGRSWSEGESTRVRQSIQNIIAVGLDRGLMEAADICPLEVLIRKERARRYGSLVLDHQPMVHVHSTSRKTPGEAGSPLRPKRKSSTLNTAVRVHRAINGYFEEMKQSGLVDTVMGYVERGAAVHITGYSMGGMLGQLLLLHVGHRVRMNQLDISKINFVGFGSPRVGDENFAAHLEELFLPEQRIIIMNPLDCVHAFPPTAEGYTDACFKIFLKEDGVGVGRRRPSRLSLLPLTKAVDNLFEHVFQSSANKDDKASSVCCTFCESKSHFTEQHRCRYCTQRGDHRGADCPNRYAPCALCGQTNHCTGEHRCRVCQQYGHRGRECHLQRDVGTAELTAFFRFHHFLYYNSNIKKSVEFSAT